MKNLYLILVIPIALSILLCSKKLLAETADIMVLYNSEANQHNDDIATRVNHLISESNSAYSDSGLDFNIRLVHLQEFNLPSGGTIDGDTLNNLRTNQTVNSLRAEYGADLVALMTTATRTNGGFICGIGYIGSGRNGQLFNNARNIAFSISAIDCGASTFTHELGHNFGLGHSRKQGSTGGVFDFGVGYGVDGEFSTIMAYGFLFNTRREINRFSSPNYSCAGFACGIDSSQANSADAAGALAPVIGQIANFFPSTIADPEPTPDPEPEPQPQPDPELPIDDHSSSLTINASFEESIEPWIATLNSTLNLSEIRRHSGKSSLAITNRSSNNAGVAQILTDSINLGATYDFSAFVRLNQGTDLIAFALGEDYGQGYEFKTSSNFGIGADEWTQITGEFTLSQATDLQNVIALVFGPSADKTIYIDDFTVTPRNLSPPAPPEPNPNTANLIQNSGFESGTPAFWANPFGGQLFVSSNYKRDGSFSLVSYNRRNWYDGPMQDISNQVQNNTSYSLTVSSRLHPSSQASDNLVVWAKIFDERGSDVWVKVAEQTIFNNIWTDITGSFQIDAVGVIKKLELYFLGPNAWNAFYIDEVTVSEQ